MDKPAVFRPLDPVERLARRRTRPPALPDRVLAQGVITTVGASTATVAIRGDTANPVAGVRWLAHVVARAGDTVWLEWYGGVPWIVGAQGPHDIIRGTFSGTTDATGFLANIPHGAPFTPSAVALIKTNTLGNPNWWQYGTDTYTATTFRARFADAGGTILNAQSVAGTFIAYL